MATIAGVDLCVSDEWPAGVQFELTQSRLTRADFELHDAFVRLRGDAGVAVASVLERHPDSLFDDAYARVEDCLDLASYSYAGTAMLDRPRDHCTLWWCDNEGNRTLRRVVTKIFVASISVSLSVRRADGSIENPAEPPEPIWTPALRYLRYAQAAADVFDAYRNAFLALEAVLSELAPKRQSEGERTWLSRALRDMSTRGLVSIGTYTKTGKGDVDEFINEQYASLRNAVFHAKAGRYPILPGGSPDRASVAEALAPLLRLVVALVPAICGSTSKSSGLTPFGFEASTIGPNVGRTTFSLTAGDKPLDVPLETGYVGKLDDAGYLHGFLARCSASALAHTSFDGVSVKAPRREGASGLEWPLDLVFDFPAIQTTGLDDFELLLVLGYENAQQPRRLYAL